MTGTTRAPLKPGRHRSQAADDAILRATLELLKEDGYGALTVASVIERAGVSSATLYRRWATKQDLVVAALGTVLPAERLAETGSLTGDVEAYLRRVASSFEQWGGVIDAIAVAARRNPDLSEVLRETFLAPRLDELTDLLRRAVERHELEHAPNAEVVFSLLVGPIYHRTCIVDRPLTPAFLRAAIAHAVRGLGGAVPPPPAR